MTSRTSKKEQNLLPKVPLQNVTNKQNIPSKQITKNCCVKLHKFGIGNMNSATVCSNKLKRTAKAKKETDQDTGSVKKKSTEDPNTPPDEQSLEEIFKTYELLRKVISRKYVSVADRLSLDFVPLCAENIEHCYQKHYKTAPAPEKPSVSQMHLVRNSIQQSRYNVFISLVTNQCLNEQFPGDTVLTNIVQMLLTLNPENKFNAFLQPILDQLFWLFDVILRRFPPCWLSIRPSYIKFLNNTIEMTKLLPDKKLNAQTSIFEVVLMLLEDTLDNQEANQTGRNRSKRQPPKSKDLNLTYEDDEYHNMLQWEKSDNDRHSFSALSNETRLSRLMQVLHLIAKLLEMDLAMWMLRYHKYSSQNIYGDDRPLAVTLFSLSNYTRSSLLVKRVTSLFALSVEKNLDEHYLKVLSRFISLLANIQNLGEIETTPAGIAYPHVGEATTTFISDLFKTAEPNMKRDVEIYIRMIETLRCPFVRYEYIDIFLKRLNPAAGRMCPEKIFENFRKSRWLECTPAEEAPVERTSASKRQAIIYRQDYLKILLYALRSYCDHHGIKEYLEALSSEDVATAEQPQKCPPSTLTNKEIDLSAMSKRIHKLEAKLDMSMKIREPRPEIPVVNIRLNSQLFLQYRNDLKYTMILQKYIADLQKVHNEDFSQWTEFLNNFVAQE